MTLSAVLSLERMLIRAGLREFGIPAWLALAVVGLVAIFDVRAALITHQLILAEPVASSFVMILASFTLGCLALSFLASPYLRISALTSPEEKVLHALAGLNPRSSLAATLLRRARSLIVPCIILAAAAAITPLDLSVALGVTMLLFAATLGAGAMSSLLASAASHSLLRYLSAMTAIVAAAVAAWQAHATTGHLALGIVPLLGAMICCVLLSAAFTVPRALASTQEARNVASRGCRLPPLPGGLAPVALVLAQTRARPLTILPWLCVAAGAAFMMRWACTNATSPDEVDRITLIGACLPAAFAAVDAGATSRHFSQSLWWLQARNVAAAVHGTVIATSLAQFALCMLIVATGTISGASLTTALAALILGTGVVVITRCVATLARRRIRRSGIVGGSGILELLEALSAAPFALIPIAILVFSSTSWSLPLSLIGPIGAFVAAFALSRSVGSRGPGRA